MAAIANSMCLPVIAFLFPVLTYGTIAMRSFDMVNYCDKTFNFSETFSQNAFTLRWKFESCLPQEGDESSPLKDCTMKIKAPEGYRMFFRFESVDLGYVDDCRRKSLEVFEGDSDSHSARSASGPICDSHYPISFETGSDAFMETRISPLYRSNTYGFRLVVTAYHTGPCNDTTEFSCGNGRCIDSSLTCNFHENCGDNSDESSCYSTNWGDKLWWVWVLVGVVVFCIILSIVVMVVCRFCKRGRSGRVVKASALATTNPKALGSPWYGQPTQQAPAQVVYQPPPYSTLPPLYPPSTKATQGTVTPSATNPESTALTGSVVTPPPYSEQDQGLLKTDPHV